MKTTKEEFLQKPYGDIIDDLNLDEMQKSETYKITFGLFVSHSGAFLSSLLLC